MKKWISRVCVAIVAIELLALAAVAIGLLVVGPAGPHDPVGFLARLDAFAREPGPALTESEIDQYFGKPNAVYSNIHERRPGVPKHYVSHYGGAESFRVFKVEGSTELVAVEFFGYERGVPRFEMFVFDPDMYETIRNDIDRSAVRD